MENRILIAYASKYGSTREVAERIGQVLRKEGCEVDVRSVKDVKDLSTYQSVIIGSATRMEKLLSEAVEFATQHASELQRMTTAYFVTGVTMKQDTPENRAKAIGFLHPLCAIKQPIRMGLFAGKLDYAKIGLLWRTMAKQDKTGLMTEGDFRDWPGIEAWAREVASALVPA